MGYESQFKRFSRSFMLTCVSGVATQPKLRAAQKTSEACLNAMKIHGMWLIWIIEYLNKISMMTDGFFPVTSC